MQPFPSSSSFGLCARHHGCKCYSMSESRTWRTSRETPDMSVLLSQSGALRSAIRGYNSARDIPIAKSQARTRLKVHRYQLAALLGGRIWKSVGSPPSLSAELPAG